MQVFLSLSFGMVVLLLLFVLTLNFILMQYESELFKFHNAKDVIITSFALRQNE